MGYKVVIIIATTILFFTGLLLGYVLSQLVLGHLPANLLTVMGTLSLILIFATLYYVLFWEFRRQQSPTSTRRTSPQPYENVPSSSEIKSRIVALLDGDTATAEGFIGRAKQDYPGMTETWYLEKVLADLEGDR